MAKGQLEIQYFLSDYLHKVNSVILEDTGYGPKDPFGP